MPKQQHVDVFIPVLGRPHRVEPLCESLLGSLTGEQVVTPVFICSPNDADEIAAVRAMGIDPLVANWEPARGDYARKMNLAFRESQADWAFLAADDLRFRSRWLEEALKCSAENGRCCVVGTNDLGNRRVMSGRHSTHTLVHVEYRECGTIDEPRSGKLFCERYSHNFCNPPEAPIWMADGTFKDLGNIEVGDTVVGWERVESEDATATVGTPRRALAYSDVLAVKRREAPLVRVVMESGREFRCTPDHRWLNATWAPSFETNPRAYAQWITPRVGRQLLHVVDRPEPLPAQHDRTVGWLAGIYDGEGSGIVVAAQSVRHNPEVVSAIDAALTEAGVNYRMSIRASGIAEFVLKGGRQSYLDFLLRIQPVRRDALLAYVLGYRPREASRTAREPIGGKRFGHRDRIVAVEDAGRDEVVSMTTSTGNYVAWGYASRNCDDEFIQTAQARYTFAHAHRSIVEHMHPDWGKGEFDATYEKGKEHFAADGRLHQHRSRLWTGRISRG